MNLISGETVGFLSDGFSVPENVFLQYREIGITSLFEWQVNCLQLNDVLSGSKSLVYSAPTSAGKTLVAEIILLKRVLETKRKAVFILPYVSVSHEKMIYFKKIFGGAGLKIGGFMGDRSPKGGLCAVDIAVCTIEKANNLLNKLIDSKRSNDLGIVIIDELHMMGDGHRGYLLELLLTKLIYMSKFGDDTRLTQIQLIGMSATLPNLKNIADWLNAQLYICDFRPIPLQEMVKIDHNIYESQNLSKPLREFQTPFGVTSLDEDQIIGLCLETMLESNGCLVFCPTKKWCETLSENIAREICRICRIAEEEQLENGFRLREIVTNDELGECMENLKRSPSGLDETLGKVIPMAVAYHHAGLTVEERSLIETSFKNGAIKILVSTSTLSSGVNLPARRVIIRTPMFGGYIIDSMTYHQMIGRAGRKGIDTKGESIIVCKSSNLEQVKQMLRTGQKPIKSALDQNDSSSLKRALLEIIATRVACTVNECVLYLGSTFLAFLSSLSNSTLDFSTSAVILQCIKYLVENDLILIENGTVDVTSSSSLDKDRRSVQPTSLGLAVLNASLGPEDGLIVFQELDKARKALSLDNDLHLIYLLTPVYLDIGGQIDWYRYYDIFSNLKEAEKRVAKLIGIDEGFITKSMRQNPSDSRVVTYRRFYSTLILYDLMNEKPFYEVINRFNVFKGNLQALQMQSANYAGMITVFCNRLGWSHLEILIHNFQTRMIFGVSEQLVDLVRLSYVTANRARALFAAGFQTVSSIAGASASDLTNILRKTLPFRSSKIGDHIDDAKYDTSNFVHLILGNDGTYITVEAAAIDTIKEAQIILKEDLAEIGIIWNPCFKTPNDNNDSSRLSNTHIVDESQTNADSENSFHNIHIQEDSSKKSIHPSKEADIDKINQYSYSLSDKVNNVIEKEIMVENYIGEKVSPLKKSKKQSIREINQTTVEISESTENIKMIECYEKNPQIDGESLSQSSGCFASQLLQVIGGITNKILSPFSDKRKQSEKINSDISPANCSVNRNSSSSLKNKFNTFPNTEDEYFDLSAVNDAMEESLKDKPLKNDTDDDLFLEDMADIRYSDFLSDDDDSGDNDHFPPSEIWQTSHKLEQINQSFNFSNIGSKSYLGDSDDQNIEEIMNVIFPEHGNNICTSPKVSQTSQKSNDAPIVLQRNTFSDFSKNDEKTVRRGLKDRSSKNHYDNDPIIEGVLNVTRPGFRNDDEQLLSPGSVKTSQKPTCNSIVVQKDRFLNSLSKDDLFNMSVEEEALGKSTKKDSPSENSGNFDRLLEEVMKMSFSIFQNSNDVDEINIHPPNNHKRSPIIESTPKDTKSRKRKKLNENNKSSFGKENILVEDTQLVLNRFKTEIFPVTDRFMEVNNKNQRNIILESKVLVPDSQLDDGFIVLNDANSRKMSTCRKDLNSGHKLMINSANFKRSSSDRFLDVNNKNQRNNILESKVLVPDSQLDDGFIVLNDANLRQMSTCRKDLSSDHELMTNSANFKRSSSDLFSDRSLDLFGNDLTNSSSDIIVGMRSVSFSDNSRTSFRSNSGCFDYDSLQTTNIEPRLAVKPELSTVNEATFVHSTSDLCFIDVSKSRNSWNKFAIEMETWKQGASISPFDRLFTSVSLSWEYQDDADIKVTGVSLATPKDSTVFFVNLNEVPGTRAAVSLKRKLEMIAQIFDNDSYTLVSFHWSTLLAGLNKLYSRKSSILPKCNLIDPLIMDWTLNSGESCHTFFQICTKYGVSDSKLKAPLNPDSINNAVDNNGITDRESAIQASVILETALKIKQASVMAGISFHDVFEHFISVEMPISRIIESGYSFKIDMDMMKAEIDKIIAVSKLLKEMAFICAGREFDIDKAQNVSKVIFFDLHLPVPSAMNNNVKGRKSSKFISTTKENLSHLLPLHPLPGIIIEYRRFLLLVQKTVGPMYDLCKHMVEKRADSRIHCCYQQLSSTGRITSIKPNLQSVPKPLTINWYKVLQLEKCSENRSGNLYQKLRRKAAELFIDKNQETVISVMRSCFVADKGCTFVSADYSQLELRVLAHFSEDLLLLDFFTRNTQTDIFKKMASTWLRKPMDKITEVDRQKAKQVSYGIVYGITSKGLSEQLSMDINKAQELIDDFMKVFPGVCKFIRSTIEICRQNGFISTLSGRRRYLLNINSPNACLRNEAERQAVHSTIQGSAADIVKISMVNLDKALSLQHWMIPNKKCSQSFPYLVLHLHDELIYEVPECLVRNVAVILKQNMESSVHLKVPLPVKVKTGKTWSTLTDF